VQHDFTLTSANEPFVGQICARLDGIPLAIELAAARSAILSVEEIAQRLDDRFALLTSGSRTALPRQQTLRATIDWSYDLLSEPERTLFRRLAVFAGGFTLDAAETVCSQGTLNRNDVLDILGRLVDKSLVIVEQGSNIGETRYHLLETIRQYAFEELEEIGQASAIRDQHLGYYLTLAEKSEPNMFGSEWAVWFRRLEKETDNIRAAIEWSTNTGKADIALRILGALVYFWFAYALLVSEWQDRVQQALARPEGKKRTLARAKALNGIGFMYWADVYPIDRRPELEEALSISRELDDAWNTATALRNLGLLENIQGNYFQARTYLEQSLAIWRQIGHAGKTGMAWTLIFLADAALNHNETDWARSLYEESTTILRQVGDLNFLAYSIRRLAQLLWSKGESEKAFALCQESLKLNHQLSDRRGVIACLAGFAAIAVAQNRFSRAANLMAAVETLAATIGIRLLYIDKMEYERNLALLKEKLDDKALAKYWSQGKAMTLEQAAAFALEGQTSG
jgi:non-specific serine/threonine protein kinase